MRGPNLDEIEGNLDGLDPLEDDPSGGHAGSLLDRLDRANSELARLRVTVDEQAAERAELLEEISELRAELDGERTYAQAVIEGEQQA